MSEEVKDKFKKKTDKELLAVEDTDTLTTDELTRYVALMEIKSKLVDAQVKSHQLDEFKRKQAETKDKYFNNGIALEKSRRDQEVQQATCSHRKGGRGLEALTRGGTDAEFSVIRHLLPTNEWWQRCTRCGKTWRPPHPHDFDLSSPEGKEKFVAAKRVYDEALLWPTDNIPSTGHTFQHHSDDGDVAAKAFVHEAMKNVNLR